MGVNIRANIIRMEKQIITTTTSVLAAALNFTHLVASLQYLRHNRDLASAKINGKFHLSCCGLTFEQNSRSVTIGLVWESFALGYGLL